MSASTPVAVWKRSSADFASSFITMAEIASGMPFARADGETGSRAMWQWIHSIASPAVKGSPPTSIS
jgi:hypothetical protein